MNRQIEIGKATHAELLTFARDTLGFNLPPNTKEETLRARIGAAWNKDHILVAEAVPDEPTQVGDQPRPATADQQAPENDKVRIIVQVTEEAGGNEPVPVGVNGKVMLIPRGEEVDIPRSYFEVLKNAITHKYEAMPGGGMNPIPRKVPLYPFQLVA